MQRKILYIGNKLSKRGDIATTIDTLSLLLIDEDYIVYAYSHVKNKIFRFQVTDLFQ